MSRRLVATGYFGPPRDPELPGLNIFTLAEVTYTDGEKRYRNRWLGVRAPLARANARLMEDLVQEIVEEIR